MHKAQQKFGEPNNFIKAKVQNSMKVSSGHWYAVLSSEELGKRPVGKMRFGERLVFWRDANGQVICFEDRCPHRGAALSLGRVHDDTIACRYHGFRYDSSGRCVAVPAEGAWHIPEQLCARTLQLREQHDFIWLWRGPKMASDELPPLTDIPWPNGTAHGECVRALGSSQEPVVERVQAVIESLERTLTKLETGDSHDLMPLTNAQAIQYSASACLDILQASHRTDVTELVGRCAELQCRGNQLCQKLKALL